MNLVLSPKPYRNIGLTELSKAGLAVIDQIQQLAYDYINRDGNKKQRFIVSAFTFNSRQSGDCFFYCFSISLIKASISFWSSFLVRSLRLPSSSQA